MGQIKLIDDLIQKYWKHLYHVEGGIACGDGWATLLDELMEVLVVQEPDITILQIKEKFGTLRFYVHAAKLTSFDLIEAAERESEHICEYCGKEAKLRDGWWLKTLCDNCHQEREKRMNKLRTK